MIFVGGSTNTPNEIVHQTCLAIQEAFELRVFACSQNPEMDESFWQVPVVLFPGGSHALSPAADAITFMMLMNSQSRKWLIGEQMKSLGVPTLMLTHLIPPLFSRQAKQGFADDVRAGGYTGKVIVCDDLDSVVLDSAVLNKGAMERS